MHLQSKIGRAHPQSALHSMFLALSLNPGFVMCWMKAFSSQCSLIRKRCRLTGAEGLHPAPGGVLLAGPGCLPLQLVTLDTRVRGGAAERGKRIRHLAVRDGR